MNCKSIKSRRYYLLIYLMLIFCNKDAKEDKHIPSKSIKVQHFKSLLHQFFYISVYYGDLSHYLLCCKRRLWQPYHKTILFSPLKLTVVVICEDTRHYDDTLKEVDGIVVNELYEAPVSLRTKLDRNIIRCIGYNIPFSFVWIVLSCQ